MTRWVVSEFATKRSRAHILPDWRYVWSLCLVDLGNSMTAGDD